MLSRAGIPRFCVQTLSRKNGAKFAYIGGRALSGGVSGASGGDDKGNDFFGNQNSDSGFPSHSELSSAPQNFDSGVGVEFQENASQVATEAINTGALLDLSMSNPSHIAMKVIENIHIAGDMPYWASIVAITVGMRVILLPVVLDNIRVTQRLQVAKPHFDKIQAKMMADPFRDTNRDSYQLEMQEVLKKYNVSQLAPLKAPLIQLPLYVTLFTAIRNMHDYFPGMKTGGAFGFTDLTVADTSYTLPLINSALFLAVIETSMMDNPQAQQGQGRTMVWVMRGLGVAMIPLTASLSTGLFVHFLTNASMSLLQTIVLKIPALKDALDLNPPIIDADFPVGTEDAVDAQFSPIEEINKDETKVQSQSPYIDLYEENQKLQKEVEDLRKQQKEEK